MSRGRRDAGVFAASIISALALLAVIVVGAQASEARINGGTFKAKGVTEASVGGEIPLGEVVIPGLGLKGHCTGGEALEASVLQGGIGHASVLLSGCAVVGNKNCTVYPSEAQNPEDAGLLYGAGSGEEVLHNGSHYGVAASPEFMIIYLGGAKCVLPEEVVVSGSFAALLPKALSELVNQPAEDINTATENLLGVALFFGAERVEVNVEGAHPAHLTGAHTGSTWGGE